MNDDGEYEPFDPFGDEQDNEIWQSVQQQMDEHVQGQQEEQRELLAVAPYTTHPAESQWARHSGDTEITAISDTFANGTAGPPHHPAYTMAPSGDHNHTSRNDSWSQPRYHQRDQMQYDDQHTDNHTDQTSSSYIGDNVFSGHHHAPHNRFAFAPPPVTMEDTRQPYDKQVQVQVQQPQQTSSADGEAVINSVSVTSTPLSNDSNRAPIQSSAAEAPINVEVVELLLSSDDEEENDDAIATKRPRLQQPQPAISLPPPGAAASYQARMAAMVNRVGGSALAPLRQAERIINPGATLNGYKLNNSYHQASQPYAAYNNISSAPYVTDKLSYPGTIGSELEKPAYLEYPPDFVPTWNSLIPPSLVKPPKRSTKKAYELSLISLSEFTITGLPLYYQGPPTPIAGLRPVIKRISREHGNAVFEKDAGVEGIGGRWKIPIGAYHAFVAYLKSDPDCVEVRTIPQLQLKIASLGRARLEKDYPTPESLLLRGVPMALAKALAPFQRGGVEFVLEREGRALLADEMGLGKTIQSIASMAVYHKEWPLLVLTPSGARYHWESEFRNWLGSSGAEASKKLEEFAHFDDSIPLSEEAASAAGHDFPLLEDSQIHVLSSSKEPVIPCRNTRIVICSYGLAPMLAKDDAIRPGMFKCAIADESHMMKNSKSKRTQFLLPILKACNRCLLLSGTPALARAAELWPQLQILASDKHPGFWESENDFVDKYVKNGNAARRAELHTMLTGTLMIRRLKDDILKDMPRKAREKVIVSIPTREMKLKMQECMELLRQGKGVMAKLARQHSSTRVDTSVNDCEEHGQSTPPTAVAGSGAAPSLEQDTDSIHQLLTGQRQGKVGTDDEAVLEQQTMAEYRERLGGIHQALRAAGHQQPYTAEAKVFLGQHQEAIYNELRVRFVDRLQAIRRAREARAAEAEVPARATVLNQMYGLTGESKIPAVVSFLSKWLEDPAKGKICVFAHHIFMLDAIARKVGLSNSGEAGTYKYIRIDGKTTPKNRQEQIDAFQHDPSVRVALLGITAAGVAVTLTASSEVLFAELFWTPAIMIQAEDRCHRIGQRARVHCKYMVASGTLDDILWKLIEKKFRELGEFVEGKEKLKMIVHKVYKNEAELHTLFDVHDEGIDDDDLPPDSVESSGDDVLPLDSSLERDIEVFGREEQAMLLAADGDDDGDEAEQILAPRNEPTQPQTGPGRSEEDAIALSDDDDENDEVVAQQQKAVDLENHNSDLNVSGSLPGCRIYKMMLQGPTLGVEVGICKGRIVVSNKLDSRVRRFGNDCKPDVGDLLVAVDAQVMPQVYKLDSTLQYLKSVLSRPQPAVMFFAEDDDFKQYYIKKFGEAKKKRKKPKPVFKNDQTLDLLLDD